MKQQYLNALLGLSLLAFPVTATAQAQQQNALPKIPKSGSPPNIVSPDKDLPDIDTSNNRAYVNPLDVIKEKEKQNNRSGFWNASDEKGSETEQKPAESSNEDTPPAANTNAPVSGTNKEAIIENLERQQQMAEEKAAAEESASKTDQDEEEKTASDADEDAESKESVADNEEENTESSKANNKKKLSEDAIKRIKSAKKSIPKAEKPQRLWSID